MERSSQLGATATAPPTSVAAETASDLLPAPGYQRSGGFVGRRRPTSRFGRYLLPTVLILVLAVLVVYPLAMLVYASFRTAPPRPGEFTNGSFTVDNYADLLLPSNLEAARNSAVVAIVATAFAMLSGGVLAFFAVRTDIPLRRLVQLAGVAPLFMPPVVAAFAWSILASPRAGQLNLLLHQVGVDFTINVYSVAGIVFVLSLYYAPYAYLFIYSALNLMNPELEQAALSHGGSRVRVLRHVTIPLLTPAFLSAGALTLVLILENFPVPQILGTGQGNIPLIPSQIFRLMQTAPSRPNEASALGMLLMVLMIVLVGLQQRIMRKRSFVTVTGKGFRPDILSLGRWRWPAFSLVAGYFFVSTALPLWALIQTAARSTVFIATFSELLSVRNLSLDGLRELWATPDFRQTTRNTIIVGVATAAVGGLFYWTLAYAVRRTDLPGRALIHQIAMAPAAMPSLVIGLGFLWAWLALPVPIYGTLSILVLAYVARFTPQGFGALSTNLSQMHNDLEESAYVSGASRLRSIVSVTVPLMRSGIGSMILLIIVLSMRELSTSVFLYTSRTEVLSVKLFEAWEGADLSVVAWIGLVFCAVMFVLAVLGRRSFLDRQF